MDSDFKDMIKQDLHDLKLESRETREQVVKCREDIATLRGKSIAWSSIVAIIFSGVIGWLFSRG